MLTFIKKNLNLIYCEFFGEKTDHLLMARALAAIVDYLILITASSVIYFVLTNQTLFTLSLELIVWIVYFTLHWETAGFSKDKQSGKNCSGSG